MLLRIPAIGTNRAKRLVVGALVLVVIIPLTSSLLVALADSPHHRPPAPVIRQQVAQILSQPEYQYQPPAWLINLQQRAVERLGRILQFIARILDWLFSGSRYLYQARPWLYWTIIALMLLTLAGFLYHILVTIQGAFGRHRQVRPANKQPPIPLSSPAVLRRQARELASRGNFAGALRKLYQACLRYLDQHGYLYYHPATTNGEYLQQVYDHPELATHLQPITQAMNRLCYAHLPITDTTYQRLDTLAQQLWQEADRSE